jgi:hypothetical protein
LGECAARTALLPFGSSRNLRCVSPHSRCDRFRNLGDLRRLLRAYRIGCAVSALLKLAECCEQATGPDRELDAAIMFDLYAKPVGQHKEDGGPTGYLWPEDNASWAFGHRFPGKDREWFTKVRHRKDISSNCLECGSSFKRETLVIERDGALVLMNELRIPPLTASLDEAKSLVPDGWFWRVGHSTLYAGWAGLNAKHPDHCDKDDEAFAEAATPALALCAAALRARASQDRP